MSQSPPFFLSSLPSRPPLISGLLEKYLSTLASLLPSFLP